MSDREKEEKLAYFLRTYINPAMVDATYAGVFDISRGYKVYAKPNFPTAATHYDIRAKNHVIFIGTNMEQYKNADTLKSIKGLTRSLLIHELGHTLFTHIENKSLKKKLKKADVPFKLFNLAEDARIEHLIKKEINTQSGLNYQFGWEEWFVNPNIQMGSAPESVLFLLINTEGKSTGKAMVSSRVREYYDRFLAAKDSFAVIDILAEWKNEFHTNPNKSPSSEMEERIQQLMEDIKDAQREMMGGDENSPEDEKNPENGIPSNSDDGTNENNPQLRNFGDIGELSDNTGEEQSLREFMEDCLGMDEFLEHGIEGDRAFRVDTDFETITVEAASNSANIFDEKSKPRAFHPKEIKNIENELKKLQKKEKESFATRKPTNRFNTGRMFGVKTDPAGTKIFNRKRERKSKKSKKNIMFVLDLSGSMSGTPVKSARTLMIAANRVAQKYKNFNITILGSKISGGYMYQTITLPANENVLLSVSADGSSEGIGYAIENSALEVKKNDLLVFLTDGNIHDKEISKSSIGKYMKDGAISVGIYVGDNDKALYNKKMKNWFDELVIKDNITDIIKEVVEIANNNSYVKITRSHSNSVDEEVSSSPKI